MRTYVTRVYYAFQENTVCICSQNDDGLTNHLNVGDVTTALSVAKPDAKVQIEYNEPYSCNPLLMCDDDKYAPIVIFVPDKNAVIRIAEGNGDDLTEADISEGDIDYIYYDCYDFEKDMENRGGSVMLKNYFRDIYKETEDCIPEVLDMLYDNPDMGYMVLKKMVSGNN